MGNPINNSQAAYQSVLSSFGKYLKKQETMVAMALDSQHVLLGKPWRAALGTANSVEVHPRDLFREAIRRNACFLIIAHNHPSGETSPSADDKAMTRRILEASKLVGIPLLDHLIVGWNKYWSFSDNNALNER